MLDKSVIQEVLNEALSTGGDFAEIFVEDRLSNNIFLIGGNVENSVSGRDYGVGIRIFDKTNSIYAYTNNSSKENLIEVAKKAAEAINGVKKNITLNLMKSQITNINNIIIMPDTVDKRRKVDLLKRAYNTAKSYDDVITQVQARYLDEIQNVLIANSEGLLIEDKRVRTRLAIQSAASLTASSANTVELNLLKSLEIM